MLAGSQAKDAIVVGAPLALIVFSLAHGLDWLVMHGMNDDNYDAFIDYIVDIRGRWLAVHLVGLVLFPLLGVAIWLMLPPGRIATRISQVGLTVCIVLYAAFDAVAGIGGAVLAGYREGLPAAERATVNGAIWSLPAVWCCRRPVARDRGVAVLRDLSHASSGRSRSRSRRITAACQHLASGLGAQRLGL